MNERPVIVSLDWDWVTGDTSDGPSCCGMCNKMGFRTNRRGHPKSVYENWRDRFEELILLPVPKKIPVYVAECHANIGEVFHKYKEPLVVDYDTHYDRYNSDLVIDCANWVVHLERWKGEYLKCGEWDWAGQRMDAVFICRSSPWTPKEMDQYFYELVWHLCFHTKTEPHFIGHMRKSMRKTYISLFDDVRAAV